MVRRVQAKLAADTMLDPFEHDPLRLAQAIEESAKEFLHCAPFFVIF